MRSVLSALALLALTGLAPMELARADEAVLRVGDQRGNARALMEAAGRGSALASALPAPIGN